MRRKCSPNKVPLTTPGKPWRSDHKWPFVVHSSVILYPEGPTTVVGFECCSLYQLLIFRWLIRHLTFGWLHSPFGILLSHACGNFFFLHFTLQLTASAQEDCIIAVAAKNWQESRMRPCYWMGNEPRRSLLLQIGQTSYFAHGSDPV
jgi:hypothetical protein